MAGRRTLESLSAADSVVDALEMAAAEVERLGKADPAAPPPQPNPLMMGMPPAAYLLHTFKVRSLCHLQRTMPRALYSMP